MVNEARKTRKAGSKAGSYGKSLAGREHCKYFRMDFSHLGVNNILPPERQIEFKKMCLGDNKN